MKFECPHCQQPIEADDEWAGMATECPTCKGSIVIPLDIAVTTTQEIANGKAPIVYATRDKLGLQLLDADPIEGREPVAMAKADLLERDPSLKEVVDLPVGWHAWREGPDGPWQRAPLPEPGQPQDDELSPEADRFLGEACEEYNAKQERLERDWRFETAVEWGFDQDTGVFKLDLADGSQLEAAGQILGSYSPDDQKWQWAWNNPHVDEAVSTASRAVRELGQRLGIDYLQEGVIPVPDPKHVAYLCGIGLKATASAGVFEGESGPFRVFIMLRNLRWTRTV